MTSCGPDGNLYVGGLLSNNVVRYNMATGAIDEFLPSSSVLVGAFHLTFDSAGNLLISTYLASSVLRFQGPLGNSPGAPLPGLGQTGAVFVPQGSGGLNSSQTMAFGPDGNLYVGSFNTNSVIRYNGTTGALIGTFVAPGSGGLSGTNDIAFRPDGFLYVGSQNNGAVYRYNATTGAFSNTFATNPYPFGGGGPTWDLVGNAYIAFGRNGSNMQTWYSRYGAASQEAFTVTLDYASAIPITVTYATADGSAFAGSDYKAVTSGTVYFAPGETSKTILIQTVDDLTKESTETFMVNLSNNVGATLARGQGVGTILDASTKFYVVDDASPDKTYEYQASGAPVESYGLSTGNSAPRGAASITGGTTVWVVDANKTVYVYNDAGALQGSWSAGGLTQPEGIAVWGNDVWIVDAGSDKVFKFPGAASLRSGTQNAAPIGSFKLAVTGNKGNRNGKGIVTDGASLWVVDDGSSDKVYKYSVSGTALGNWTMNGGGGSPTGITLNPASPSSLWIVDSASDKVYEYTAAVGVLAGSLPTSTSFALAVGNANPQDIADPPVGDSAPLATSAMAPMAPLMTSKAIDSALTQLSDELVRNRVGRPFETDRADSATSIVPPPFASSTQQSMQPPTSENRGSSQAERLVGTTDDIFSQWNSDELKDFEM